MMTLKRLLLPHFACKQNKNILNADKDKYTTEMQEMQKFIKILDDRGNKVHSILSNNNYFILLLFLTTL